MFVCLGKCTRWILECTTSTSRYGSKQKRIYHIYRYFFLSLSYLYLYLYLYLSFFFFCIPSSYCVRIGATASLRGGAKFAAFSQGKFALRAIAQVRNLPYLLSFLLPLMLSLSNIITTVGCSGIRTERCSCLARNH